MMLDYQWPTPTLNNLGKFNEKLVDKDLIAKHSERLNIEFSKIFAADAVIFPSARAGISAILEFNHVSRADAVFAPHYSSHCLWDVIGRYASPTIFAYNEKIKLSIAVHKYGFLHCNPPPATILVEDSVDSIIKQPCSLFSLDGLYEVFSLPKTIGTWSGGVVISKDINFLTWVKELQKTHDELALFQSKLKYLNISGKLPKFQHPYFLEYRNRTLDINGINNINDQLRSYSTYIETIQSRIDKVKRKFGDILYTDEGRLPCAIPFSKKLFTTHTPEKWMVRNFNLTKNLSSNEFQACWILPLHFRISEDYFSSLLADINKR